MNSSPSDSSCPSAVVRPARPEDSQGVLEFLQPFAERELLLKRTRAETDALLPTAFLAEQEKEIVGFCAIEIYSRKLAEIQCLAVSDACQGKGIGSALVNACVDLARMQGVMEVLAISASEDFLQRLGFDYSLPAQKKALFFSLRSREEVYGQRE